MGNMIDREATPKAQSRRDVTLLTAGFNLWQGKRHSVQSPAGTILSVAIKLFKILRFAQNDRLPSQRGGAENAAAAACSDRREETRTAAAFSAPPLCEGSRSF